MTNAVLSRAKTSRKHKISAIEACRPLILKLATNFKKKFPSLDLDDLIQEAEVAVLVCIQKYHPIGRNFSFLNYLKRSIVFSFKRYVHKNLYIIRIPENKPLGLKIEQIEDWT